MLSVYKLLRPPKYGNCTVLPGIEGSSKSLSFEEFKAVFSCEPKNRAIHLQAIKSKLVLLSEADDWDFGWIDTERNTKDHEVFKYIIYYLTGFICRKVSKETSCICCKTNLDIKNPLILPAVADLVTFKSRGGLNYPKESIFTFFY